MMILPVLDICGGVVVHARGGRRECYLPLVSPSCADPSPLSTVASLLRLYPFQHLYVADLDAIKGTGDNGLMIGAIALNYPDLELWVDAGAASCDEVEYLFTLGVARPVVGTETLPDMAAWQRLQAAPWAERLVLSLDYQEGSFLGPAGLGRQPDPWPAAVIAMSLDRVGSKKGPDWPLLTRLKQERPSGGKLLAAGGIRGMEDLRQLAGWGASGVLLASALYSGSLGMVELQQLS
jgi:phosphoribosylformimino-5-aminoimidazole carboxamide ribotide isomerase